MKMKNEILGKMIYLQRNQFIIKAVNQTGLFPFF